jgi:hypothetical protein
MGYFLSHLDASGMRKLIRDRVNPERLLIISDKHAAEMASIGLRSPEIHDLSTDVNAILINSVR